MGLNDNVVWYLYRASPRNNANVVYFDSVQHAAYTEIKVKLNNNRDLQCENKPTDVKCKYTEQVMNL